MLESWIQERIRESMAVAREIVRAPISFVSQRCFGFMWWVDAHRGAIHNEINSWRYWQLWWPFDSMRDFVCGWLDNIVDWVLFGVREVGEVGLRWVNSLWYGEFDDWWPNYYVVLVFLKFHEWGGRVGYELDRVIELPLRIIQDLINWVLDHIGNCLGVIEMLVIGSQVNIWPYFRDTSANHWDALWYMAIKLGQALLTIPGQIINWVRDQLDFFLEPVGWALGEINRRVAGTWKNDWDAVKSICPNRWEAVKIMAEALGDNLRRVIIAIVNDALAPLRAVADTVENIDREFRKFLADPGGYIWAIIYPTLLKRIEEYLNERWDINV